MELRSITKKTIVAVAIVWSLFQIWYASPYGSVAINSTEARAIHLSFAIFLGFITTAGEKKFSLELSWLLGLLAAFCASYLYLFYAQLAQRSGLPTTMDLVVALLGIFLLLEATRRVLGWPLVIVVSVFLIYSLAGPHMPEVIAHKGASLNKLASHQWLGTEGVFGIALGVSTSFVFLFVLFGALLEKAGAGNYFLQTSFALLGHMRGGPAKAAVVSSGLSGVISGSSIANVVTTGTFTIPLMKKVGFPGEKAGAIEVAASTNGQLTPPVMGAAAFLMVEYVGISYIEVIKHAILPAIISYIALVFIVHLEACKAGMSGLQKLRKRPLTQKLLLVLSTMIVLMLLTLAVYYGLGWLKVAMPESAIWVISALVLATYIGTVLYTSRFPLKELKIEELEVLPDSISTIKSGLHYLLPIVILLWCLTVERFSPGKSAFWALLFMIFITLTQRPLAALFRGESELLAATKQGWVDFYQGLYSGGYNMIGIGIATATAGLVVGTVTLTGIGLVMTEFVEFISGGNLLLILVFTAIICLLLGMGLPTTANYIVVSTLMAPVIVSLGADNGLVVPLVAAHMFVFYFGILADDTPPVGLAAYAAAGIAKSDPIKTGIQGFTYDIRTAILPFMFIFNTQLLLIGIDGIFELLVVIVTATIGMLAFSSATQHFWIVKNRVWETLALLLVSLTLFNPNLLWDRIFPPIETMKAEQLMQTVETLPEQGLLKLQVEGENIDGDQVSKQVTLSVGANASAAERLAEMGLELRNEEGKHIVDMVTFDSAAQKAGIELDWEITQVMKENDRPNKYWLAIPALFLLWLIWKAQAGRRRQLAKVAVAA